MAQVILDQMIASISGSLGKDCPFSFVTMNGKTFTRAKPRRKFNLTKDPNEPLPPAPAPNAQQKAHQLLFGETNKMVNEIIHTTHLRARYEKEWVELVKKRKTKKTLKGYIFQQLYKKYK